MLAYGERKTWPLLHAIRSHCVVEMSLEKCVQVRALACRIVDGAV